MNTTTIKLTNRLLKTLNRSAQVSSSDKLYALTLVLVHMAGETGISTDKVIDAIKMIEARGTP